MRTLLVALALLTPAAPMRHAAGGAVAVLPDEIIAVCVEESVINRAETGRRFRCMTRDGVMFYATSRSFPA